MFNQHSYSYSYPIEMLANEHLFNRSTWLKTNFVLSFLQLLSSIFFFFFSFVQLEKLFINFSWIIVSLGIKALETSRLVCLYFARLSLFVVSQLMLLRSLSGWQSEVSFCDIQTNSPLDKMKYVNRIPIPSLDLNCLLWIWIMFANEICSFFFLQTVFQFSWMCHLMKGRR